MPIERTPIVSNPGPDEGHPWYEMQVNLDLPDAAPPHAGIASLRITRDADGGYPGDNRNVTADLTQLDMTEDAFIATREDGSIVVDHADQVYDDLRAHLAWWHADTETLEVLEFITPAERAEREAQAEADES